MSVSPTAFLQFLSLPLNHRKYAAHSARVSAQAGAIRKDSTPRLPTR
jgi:hypothetical protein